MAVLSQSQSRSIKLPTFGKSSLTKPYKYHFRSSKEIKYSIPTELLYFLIIRFRWLSFCGLFLSSLLLVSRETKFLKLNKSGFFQII